MSIFLYLFFFITNPLALIVYFSLESFTTSYFGFMFAFPFFLLRDYNKTNSAQCEDDETAMTPLSSGLFALGDAEKKIAEIFRENVFRIIFYH